MMKSLFQLLWLIWTVCFYFIQNMRPHVITRGGMFYRKQFFAKHATAYFKRAAACFLTNMRPHFLKHAAACFALDVAACLYTYIYKILVFVLLTLKTRPHLLNMRPHVYFNQNTRPRV